MKCGIAGTWHMSSNRLRILVIDDDPLICKLLKIILNAQSYVFDAVSTGCEGIEQSLSFHPDLVILELDLPDMDGKEVVCEIRKSLSIPIIVLTSRNQVEEKVAVLNAGADDYVTKPFYSEEFLARTQVALRRSMPGGKSVVFCHELVVDLIRCYVTVNGKNVRMTPVEYEIMKALAKQQGKTLTYSQLLEIVRGKTEKRDIAYLRTYIANMRRKIEADPVHPRYIINEPNVGYRLAY